MTLVYFKESSRRRNDRGITTNLSCRLAKNKTQNYTKGNLHKHSHPKVSIDKKRNGISALVEPPHNTWHEISNDDQVADPNAKAFDSNCSVEKDRCVGICDLRQEEVPRSRYRAHLDCKYSPKAAVVPDHRITMVPRVMPICDIANGIARSNISKCTLRIEEMYATQCSGADNSVDKIDIAADPRCLTCEILFLQSPTRTPPISCQPRQHPDL
jgi:hypothetical protein